MRMIATSLLLLAVSAIPSSAETPLQQFLRARGYRGRLNPGSLSLVGDIYPDKDQVGTSRVFKLSECFSDIRPDDLEALDETAEVLTYDTSDVSILLNVAKKNPSNSTDDIAKLEAGFASNHVRYVALKATSLFHLGVSTGPMAAEASKSPCAQALLQTRDYVVSDAIGAKTLSYDFLDDSKRSISGSLSALVGLLFKVGLSNSSTTIGTATFTSPVYIGFSLVRWNQGNKQFDHEK